MASSELFLDRGALAWDADTQRGCLRAFAERTALPGHSNLTSKCEYLLNRSLAAESEAARAGSAVAAGFKWMVSQDAPRHWPWFVRLCAANGVRLCVQNKIMNGSENEDQTDFEISSRDDHWSKNEPIRPRFE